MVLQLHYRKKGSTENKDNNKFKIMKTMQLLKYKYSHLPKYYI